MNRRERNIKDLLLIFGNYYKNIHDNKLREEYKKFLYIIGSNNLNLKSVFLFIDSRIKMFNNKRNNVKFWKDIQKLLINIYKY